MAWIFTLLGLKNHTVLHQFVFADNCGYTFTIWYVFMVGCDRERGRKAKCAANEDKTWLHVYDCGNITYKEVGVMKAARFGFFLVQARTNMDTNKLVIFTYDRVPAYRVSATPPAP